MRVFFRSITSATPTPDDFKSYAALGRRPRRTDPEFSRLWEGLSVYDTYRQARRNAEATNWRIGAYIAELHVPDHAPMLFEGPTATGHWNLYDAEPALLLRCVVRVVHAPSTER